MEMDISEKCLCRTLASGRLHNCLATINFGSNPNRNNMCWGGLQKSTLISCCNSQVLKSDQFSVNRYERISLPSSCTPLLHHVRWQDFWGKGTQPSYARAHALPARSSAFQMHFEKPRHPSKVKLASLHGSQEPPSRRQAEEWEDPRPCLPGNAAAHASL